MCDECGVLLGELEARLLVTEAERTIIMAEADAGVSVPDARRPLFDHEVRATIRFGEIDETVRHAEALASAETRRALAGLVDALAPFLPEEATPDDMRAALATVALDPPEALRVVLDRYASALAGVLTAVRERGRQGVLGEAARQGVPEAQTRLSAAPGESSWGPFIFGIAQAVGTSLWTQVTQRAMGAAATSAAQVSRADVTDVVLGHAYKGVVDEARQNVHVQHNAGRADAVQELPDPAELYAGELLDQQTCVLPGTLVSTNRGGVPVEDVTEGDLVLTHRGRWMPVVGTSAHLVREEVVRIKWSGGVLRLTRDHPVLVVRGRGYAWVDAGLVRPGDQVVERGGEAVRPDDGLREAVDRVPECREVLRLTGVNVRPEGMPVGPVRLDDGERGDEEIDGPPTDSCLCRMRHSGSLKALADGALNAGLRGARPVAVGGAVSAGTGLARRRPELGPALLAPDGDGRAAARLGTVGSALALAVPERGTAAGALGGSTAGVQTALARTVRVPPGVADGDREVRVAVGAPLRDGVSRRSEAAHDVRGRVDAGAGAVRGACAVSSFNEGAAGGAEAVGRSTAGAGGVGADSTHTVILVEEVTRIKHEGAVHDLTVYGDHSFTAAGVVVHNCSPCSHVDGKRYDSEEEAEEEYPAGGPYVQCEGGNRCRGTLVYIWDGDDAQGEPPAPRTPDAPPAPRVDPDNMDTWPAGPDPDTVIPPDEWWDSLPDQFQNSPARGGPIPQNIVDMMDQFSTGTRQRIALPPEPEGVPAVKGDPFDRETAMRGSNPDRERMNCQNCYVSHEMRRRGYAVEARGEVEWTVADVAQEWVSADGQYITPDTSRSADAFTQAIMRHPAGARGGIAVKWYTGTGHVFNWEIDDAGRAFLVDPQVNEIIPLVPETPAEHKAFRRFLRNVDWDFGTVTFRVDNAKWVSDPAKRLRPAR